MKIIRKKGSIVDITYLMVGIFTLTVIVLLVSLMAYHINSRVQEISIFSDDAKTASASMSTKFPQTMNTMLVVIFIVGCILSLILASQIPVHPAFLIVFIFEWLLMIWMGSWLADVYQVIIENSNLSVISESFVFTTFFFRFFPIIIGVVGVLLAIVMYKTRGLQWQ
jgi:hypothetical protein